MRKTLLALATLVVLATGAPAVADATDPALLARLEQLTHRVVTLGDRLEHKDEVLACERGNRRELARALRTGDHDVVLTDCR